MKRVALYIRVSTEEQAIHGLSIEAQTEALDEWARENHYEIADHYIDAGISARKKASNRPSLQRLLADIQAGKIELVAFTKLDRWFRNIAEYYKVQEVLEKYHVDWKTIHEDYDTSSAAGRLKINIMLSVAQDEADRTSERIKAVFKSKRTRKEPVSGNVPYGYRIEGKHVVVDEKAAPAVRAFFDEYLASRLVSSAISSAERENGEKMSYYRAKTILRSPAYCGVINGVSGMCDPYITDEQFKAIAESRSSRPRTATKNRVYLFSGILFCGDCGHRMTSRTCRSRRVYNCQYHYRGGICENKVNIAEKDIEQFLIENVNHELVKFAASSGAKKAMKKNPEINVDAVKRKLVRLKDLYVNEIIDLETYRKDYEKFQHDIYEAEKAKNEQANSGKSINRIKNYFPSGWENIYEGLTIEQKRKFWISSIGEIQIFPDRSIKFTFA